MVIEGVSVYYDMAAYLNEYGIFNVLEYNRHIMPHIAVISPKVANVASILWTQQHEFIIKLSKSKTIFHLDIDELQHFS